MIAVDTNVLIYAHRREVAEHAVARDRLRALAAGRDPWAIPWPCVYEFFSVVTNPNIWRQTASTSPVEGLNNKIRVIQRRCYGLRDEDDLHLKILTCTLPPLSQS